MESKNKDRGILLLRIFSGGFMLWNHGWPKLMKFGEMWGSFPDPLGFGSNLSLILTVFAEFLCSLLIVTGTYTRLASIPLLITMLTAAFVIHADDPWSKKEFALIYAVMFATLLFTGGGRYTLDKYWRGD